MFSKKCFSKTFGTTNVFWIKIVFIKKKFLYILFAKIQNKIRTIPDRWEQDWCAHDPLWPSFAQILSPMKNPGYIPATLTCSVSSRWGWPSTMSWIIPVNCKENNQVHSRCGHCWYILHILQDNKYIHVNLWGSKIRRPNPDCN